MKQIKIKDLPDLTRFWFNQATEGKRKSNYSIYGFNSRFILVKQFIHSVDGADERSTTKAVQWLIIEWTQQKNLNTFLFKKVGGLVRSDKAKILKDFSINLSVIKK
jgi:hypothetical protein